VKITPITTGTVAVRPRQVRGVRGPLRVPATLVSRGWTAPMPMRAWLIEHPDGLLVVDTGETARVSEPGYLPSWHVYYRRCLRQWITPDDEIGPQLRARGVSPDDVRWVVLTHMHTDHAGGLDHFRRAEIVVSHAEWASATGFMGRQRGYLNQHWPSWLSPTLIEGDHELADGVTLLATPGHSAGHLSVLLDGDPRVVLAGDASYTQQFMLDGVLDGVSPQPRAALASHARLRRLVAERPTVYLPSHDPDAEARLTGGVPA
jgi:glyoxylase-like metal-dependent hydrolase (beta-lactamase superfamily II)